MKSNLLIYVVIKNAEELIAYLEETISARFSDDYFNITLPNELNSASANSPAWNAYIASQIVLNTPMLFSTSQLAKYLCQEQAAVKMQLISIILFLNII